MLEELEKAHIYIGQLQEQLDGKSRALEALLERQIALEAKLLMLEEQMTPLTNRPGTLCLRPETPTRARVGPVEIGAEEVRSTPIEKTLHRSRWARMHGLAADSRVG